LLQVAKPVAKSSYSSNFRDARVCPPFYIPVAYLGMIADPPHLNRDITMQPKYKVTLAFSKHPPTVALARIDWYDELCCTSHIRRIYPLRYRSRGLDSLHTSTNERGRMLLHFRYCRYGGREMHLSVHLTCWYKLGLLGVRAWDERVKPIEGLLLISISLTCLIFSISFILSPVAMQWINLQHLFQPSFQNLYEPEPNSKKAETLITQYSCLTFIINGHMALIMFKV
jgi:hypothetical protein